MFIFVQYIAGSVGSYDEGLVKFLQGVFRLANCVYFYWVCQYRNVAVASTERYKANVFNLKHTYLAMFDMRFEVYYFAVTIGSRVSIMDWCCLFAYSGSGSILTKFVEIFDISVYK